MPVVVQIPGPLLLLTAGRRTVTLEASPASVQQALEHLFIEYPGLRDRVLTEQGTVREHVNVFVGAENIRYLDGLATALTDPAEIMIVPAVSGGKQILSAPFAVANG